jgi:hypothetical protein
MERAGARLLRARIKLVLAGIISGALLICLGSVSAAAAAEPPYEFNPMLSLTAGCQVSAFDPVPDPGCPYSPPPAGPTEKFKEPRAIAIDPYGNEYVATADEEPGRIVVFDDEGFFITELAVPLPKSIAVDSKGNLYVLEGNGKVVRYEPSATYEPEAGDIEYEDPAVTVSSSIGLVGAVAIDFSNDHLFRAAPNKIIEYGTAEESNAVLGTSEPEKLGDWTNSLAVDAQRRRLYVSFCADVFSDCGILVLDADSPDSELKEIDGSTTPPGDFAAGNAWLPTAVDEELGYFFVQDFSANPGTVYQFNEDYEYLSSLSNDGFEANTAQQIAVSNGERPPNGPGDDAFNRHVLFIPTLPGGQIGNRALAYEPPGQTAPVIEGVSAASIGETEAELRAEIFPGGLETEYALEITTQASFEAEGFAGATTVGEGSIPSDSLATEVSAFATGLTPGETYRFRAVAANEIGPALEEGQNEATFTTYSDALIDGNCFNQALRLGRSAQLPDCRAYELVTPPDTAGRPPRGIGFPPQGTFSTLQTSPTGNALSFKIEGGSLPDSSGVGSFEGDPYVATRGGSGWSSELAGASGDEATVSIPGSTSPDQGYAFWTARIEGPLVIGGINTEYLRYPDGHSELIGRGSLGNDPRAAGAWITENASHIVFVTVNSPGEAIQLEPNAPPTGTRAVYDRTIDPISGAEQTHVVSLLPGDATPGAGEDARSVGISPDGEGIAFEIGSTLYLRVDNEETFEIGTGVEFAGVSEGGERIFYVEGEDLLAFDASTETVIPFSTTGDVTPVNVSTEGTRAYFASPSVLGAANPEGDEAEAGEQNLYLSEEGAISFVATVTDRDVEGEIKEGASIDGLGLWTMVGDQLARDPSRLNPDGTVLLFQSRANITGYEESAFPQIYRYDAAGGSLSCISCIPTETPATGGASLQSYAFESFDPQPFSPFAFVPNIASDGDRVFFESEEALVSDDTDEVKDVYEWEEEGVGSCDREGGCVYLISSGVSARDNFLYAHSESGDDIFFTTGDQLTGRDGSAAVSIYDAKVGGGFAEPVKEDCVADGCRPSITPAPTFGKPVAGGEGDVPPEGKKRKCPKGKRKVKKNGKVRCVKKKQGKAGKQGKGKAGKNRGAAR